MLNFLNLEYFLVAAEELNFTKAAKRLFISQQSLSSHIASLEKDLDVTLFDRTSPLTLTYAGHVFASRARTLLDLKEEAFREMADIKDFTTGQLTIGVSHTRGRVILPEILPAYRRLFPGIELSLLEGNSQELDHALFHGDVDLIIGMKPFSVEHVQTVPICNEDILLAVSDSLLEQYFPNRKQVMMEHLSHGVDLRMLAQCPVLTVKKGNRVRTIMDEMYQDAQITPSIIFEAENIETILALAAKGMGITFYPQMFIRPSRQGLNFYPLSYGKAHGVLAIGYYKNRYLPQAAKEFIRIAIKILQSENNTFSREDNDALLSFTSDCQETKTAMKKLSLSDK